MEQGTRRAVKCWIILSHHKSSLIERSLKQLLGGWYCWLLTMRRRSWTNDTPTKTWNSRFIYYSFLVFIIIARHRSSLNISYFHFSPFSLLSTIWEMTRWAINVFQLRGINSVCHSTKDQLEKNWLTIDEITKTSFSNIHRRIYLWMRLRKFNVRKQFKVFTTPNWETETSTAHTRQLSTVVEFQYEKKKSIFDMRIIGIES